MPTRIQTRNEELLNGISHVLGILFCLIGIPFLIAKANERHNFIIITSVIVFGIGMLLVYTFSSLYHLVQNEKRKQLLKIADHICIYYLLIRTYSSLMIAYLVKKNALFI